MSADPIDLAASARNEQAATRDRLMMTSAKGYEQQLRRIGQSESPEHPVNRFLADLDQLRAIEQRAREARDSDIWINGTDAAQWILTGEEPS